MGSLENSSQAARKHVLSVLEPTRVTSGSDKDLVVGKLLEFAVRPHLEAHRAGTVGRCLDEEGRYDEALQQYDVSHQLKLAATVRLERSSMVPMLDKLSRRGLIERRASATDRRHNHLHLTDAGRELLAEAVRRASQHEKEVCKPFTIAEKKMLLELLGRFRASKKSESA